ncbi:Os05g0196300 [Oryza sativa Japonica Group]|nr:Os05g0196300 [Oryza sativa Japonica Group]
MSPLPHGRPGGDDLTGARLSFPPPLPRRRPSGGHKDGGGGASSSRSGMGGDLLGGGGTSQIHATRPDLAVEQLVAGLSGAAVVSGGGGSGVEALAATEETARSAPGSGGTTVGGGIWWRRWRRWQGRRGDGIGKVNLADGGGDEFAVTAARATTAGCLRRVSSELDDGDKVREDDEMAPGMEGLQRLRWWRRRWRGDGVSEANLATPAADLVPEESGGHGDGGDEFAATTARATTVGGLRRVPLELDDGEKG